jgi:hypothetical protein
MLPWRCMVVHIKKPDMRHGTPGRYDDIQCTGITAHILRSAAEKGERALWTVALHRER